jgi:hypothetical protein
MYKLGTIWLAEVEARRVEGCRTNIKACPEVGLSLDEWMNDETKHPPTFIDVHVHSILH